MKGRFILLFAVLALGCVAGTAVADADGEGTTPWDDETSEENNSTGVAPGQQLAGAVGAQGASVEGELWNRTLSDKLDNASTPGERAAVIENETETLEAYIESLERARGNLTEAWNGGEISESEYRTSLSAFIVRARLVEQRANRTARAAEELSVGVREIHDVNVTEIRNLSDRARELYHFEDEIAREVVNETLESERAALGTDSLAVEADDQ